MCVVPQRGERQMCPRIVVATKLLTACWLLGTLSSCVLVAGMATQYSRNVTDNPKLIGGYEPDGLYELKVDSFLFEGNDWRRKPLFVEPPEQYSPPGTGREYDVPESLEDYHAHHEDWPEIKGILPKGTRVRLIKMIKHGSLALPGYEALFPIGRIEGGAFDGRIVDLSDVSGSYEPAEPTKIGLVKPREEYLRRVEESEPPP